MKGPSRLSNSFDGGDADSNYNPASTTPLLGLKIEKAKPIYKGY
eukprot:CAMPEP_0170500884 /NCGR_PEP_ID=MMETSP0208-20121228/36424_1 /TAXON_ID=197538 /ORGANISM="Strombidium inclinatum, Strain S3" /LENGTH=43 /DNA_ID= /DNA_START= /DNA_END= /DNA_ORIENTATION=